MSWIMLDPFDSIPTSGGHSLRSLAALPFMGSDPCDPLIDFMARQGLGFRARLSARLLHAKEDKTCQQPATCHFQLRLEHVR